MDAANWVWMLLTAAWLTPLLGFVAELFAVRWGWTHRLSRAPAYVAIACIAISFACSWSALQTWGDTTHWAVLDDLHPASATNPAAAPQVISGTYYQLAKFGPLELSLGYYIDSLTLLMFVLVTFVALCIHIFAVGYMRDELTEDYEDDAASDANEPAVTRPGRFHRFFAYLSLFCWAMLGLILAGNLLQVFMFWELVGLCSYLLIGFYTERRSATRAANKAFLMTRIGDCGFLVGLLILWNALGTLQFAATTSEPGLLTVLMGPDQSLEFSRDRQRLDLHLPNGVWWTEGNQLRTIEYWLMVAAGLGILAGCIGKSAQFPLQSWLPDAMEGPTPVSALVHSATMVAAGIYLAVRCSPLFVPEVLLTAAYIGCATMLLAAISALAANDIKRVLAYSTISQLGYMLLAVGVGGTTAAVFHLATHACFKSLLFLGSGSVILACHHVQDLRRYGGLWSRMPITGGTMLVGVIALSGLGLPLIRIFGEPIAFAGFHSKDAILAATLAFTQHNAGHGLLFLIPLVTAGLTACYAFRMWFLTFAGAPRDTVVIDHARESSSVMTVPLLVLAIVAAGCAVGGEHSLIARLAEFTRSHAPAAPAAVDVGAGTVVLHAVTAEAVHHAHPIAGRWALAVAMAGAATAYLLYGRQAAETQPAMRGSSVLADFAAGGWRFDDVYDATVVRPALVFAKACETFDRVVIDEGLHRLTRGAVWLARWDQWFDERMVDGAIRGVGDGAAELGERLRRTQTGLLRHYVLFLAAGVVVLFAVLFTTLPR